MTNEDSYVLHDVIIVTGIVLLFWRQPPAIVKEMSDCTPELILGCLRGILSGRSEERRKAEEEIRVLEVGESKWLYPFALTRITCRPHKC